jgi:acyl-CoA synthetase (AMP-forming)/AMP-acid ligase II
VDPNLNWITVLEHHADRMPDKPLATMNGATRTYAQMLTGGRRLAGGLAELGVGRGDVVGLLAHNCTEFLEVIYAANHLGAIAMPVNWRLAAEEVRYILTNSGAKVLVSEAELAEVAVPAAARAEQPVVGVALDSVDAEGWQPLERLRSAAAPGPVAPASADDLHRLMYTSGTTSHPKGVMISHGNLLWKNVAHIAEFGITPDDVGLVCGPLYHVGALDLTATTLIHAGASLVIHRTFDARRVVEEMGKGEITNVWLAPAMINDILNLPDVDDHDLASVRLIIDGGEKMPEPLIMRLQGMFPNAWFADAYGLTETVSGDTFLDKRKTLERLGSVGKPCLHLEVDIWDPQGRSLPPMEHGEIVLRGPKVFMGYWRDPEATAKAFEGGWFHTGDIGYLDSDGYLYIVDRLKDLIVSGGENVASLEVERVLYEHPEVLEAAVVGQPHQHWGEVPVAFVRRRPQSAVTSEELIAHCRRGLAKFKVPAAVTFVDALPRNPSGKVLKRVLRDQSVPHGRPG